MQVICDNETTYVVKNLICEDSSANPTKPPEGNKILAVIAFKPSRVGVRSPHISPHSPGHGMKI